MTEGRATGVVTKWDGAWGFVEADAGGTRHFFRRADVDVPEPFQLVEGQPVRFRPAKNDRGGLALDVRPLGYSATPTEGR
jgi:cold shock CspA family protein